MGHHWMPSTGIRGLTGRPSLPYEPMTVDGGLWFGQSRGKVVVGARSRPVPSAPEDTSRPDSIRMESEKAADRLALPGLPGPEGLIDGDATAIDGHPTEGLACLDS